MIPFYKILVEQQSFSTALESLKTGELWLREPWLYKTELHAYVRLVKETKGPSTALFWQERIEPLTRCAHFQMISIVSKFVTPWMPDTPDLLAEDWLHITYR